MSAFFRQQVLRDQDLPAIDQAFLTFLSLQAPHLGERLLSRRRQPCLSKGEDEFLIELAKQLEAFLAQGFGVGEEVARLQASTLSHQPIFAFKKYYVVREARRRVSENLLSFKELDEKISVLYSKSDDPQLTLASHGLALLNQGEAANEEVQRLIDWCARVLLDQVEPFCQWEMFALPKKRDFDHLVVLESDRQEDGVGRLSAPAGHLRQRDGFHLTDRGMSERKVMQEVDYCVYCHKNEGDFCSKGFPEKKRNPEIGFKRNPLDELLTGCPLEEKISEMHTLKRDGYTLGALAMIMVDNPMCALTGHRICNDCMKACIYQKQDPVNIPEIETRILKDVLNLPWGVEIYELLTRWNPLRQEQWLIKPYNGKKVLVMGLGPAGITMAHHLTMEGCLVVGADGLKIEPLPVAYLQQPIKHFADLQEDLADRLVSGFGGVAEYGITVRWDKNFLKLAYLTLMRRQYFQCVGSVRFGGTITVEKAWRLGFDHLSVAVGAGLPRELNVPHSLAIGMRQANDFLMALQLTGAAKANGLANLQLRMPVVVIGGGLTGIDAATEAQAYYICQVEKMAKWYRTAVSYYGERAVRAQFSQLNLSILDEMLAHARLVLLEREKAEMEQREPDFIQLLRGWGGVTVAYRKTLQQSPAYRRNPEEVQKAVEEGIYYRQNLDPLRVLVDEQGHAVAMEFKSGDDTLTLPARTILVATGATPNVAYAFEHKGTFNRVGFEYQSYRQEDQLVAANNEAHCKDPSFGAFTSYENQDKRVSFIGDTHPVFHGSVVKAIASAKLTYPQVMAVLDQRLGEDKEGHAFQKKVSDYFSATVVSVTPLNEKAFELTVRAPSASAQFQPGQFYKLQTFSCSGKTLAGTQLASEGVAVMGALTEQPDQLAFTILKRGASTDVLSTLEPGTPMNVMGPTGNALHREAEPKRYVIVGSEMAVSLLRSVVPSLKQAGHHLTFIAKFSDESDVFHRQWLLENLDEIHWLIGAPIEQVINQLREETPDVVWCVSSPCDQQAIAKARLQGQLPQAKYIAAVYGPMQCMLKGVCAQCLQWQIDPMKGGRKKAVYACSWQHQPMELVEFANIDERLGQNAMQEKLALLFYQSIKGV